MCHYKIHSYSEWSGNRFKGKARQCYAIKEAERQFAKGCPEVKNVSRKTVPDYQRKEEVHNDN